MTILERIKQFLWLDHEIIGSLRYLNEKFDHVIASNHTLKKDIANMAVNIEALAAEVERVHTVQESAVMLLQKLAHEIEMNKSDPVAMDDLVAKLKASTDALAMAVATSDDVLEAPKVEEPAPEVVVDAPVIVVEEPVVEAPAVEEPAVSDEPKTE